MVHSNSIGQDIGLLSNYKRPSSPCTNPEKAKRARLVDELSLPNNDELSNNDELPDNDDLEELSNNDSLEELSNDDNLEFELLSSSETDYIIYEPTGGMIFDSEEACTQHNEFMSRLQWEPESDPNNPLHPWKHQGEIWLTDLLFRNAVSRTTADDLLSSFANERISMVDGPIQFTNSKEMIELLDVAAKQGTVCFKSIRDKVHNDKVLTSYY
jgi:hypothetical protein